MVVNASTAVVDDNINTGYSEWKSDKPRFRRNQWKGDLDGRRIPQFQVVLASSLTQPSAAADKKPIVAVFKIENKGTKLTAQMLEHLAVYLATRLSESGAFEVVPPTRLKAALTGKKRESYKQCYSQSCQIAIGQELSADKALSTQVMKMGKTCMVTSNLYDLEKSTSGKGASARSDCTEEALSVAFDSVVAKLTGAAAPSTPPSAPAGVLAAKKQELPSKPPQPTRKAKDHQSAPIAASPNDGGGRVVDKLSQSDIRAGMLGIKPKVDECGFRHRVRGIAQVDLTITAQGVVTASTVYGDFAETPAGRCVEAATRQAVFPRAKSNESTRVRYPFLLRDVKAKKPSWME